VTDAARRQPIGAGGEIAEVALADAAVDMDGLGARGVEFGAGRD